MGMNQGHKQPLYVIETPTENTLCILLEILHQQAVEVL